MKYNFIMIIFFVMSQCGLGQEPGKKDCYEIKHLDFFGLDNMVNIKWPESELSSILATVSKNDTTDTSINTNFLIPIIVFQLKNFHPDCVSEIDTAYFNALIEIYCTVRRLKKDALALQSIPDQIDFLRDDFYKQVQNDTLLAYMSYTLDDGPFHGIDFETSITLEKTDTLFCDFGSLLLSKLPNKLIMTCIDKKENRIWQKAITGLDGKYLTDLKFYENSIDRNSLANIIHMSSEGERFTLYLKQDGKFMFYFHSW